LLHQSDVTGRDCSMKIRKPTLPHTNTGRGLDQTDLLLG
jgi:hypothetical protein